MATASVALKSREEYRKQLELESARKAGLVPAEVDENGKEINPHIPQFVSSSPWYLKASIKSSLKTGPSLKHQRNWKSDQNHIKLSSWYDRGAKTFQADKYRKGACENCGAMSHNAKSCIERPRKIGAKWNDNDIAPDEKIEKIELDYDGKHDRWNGYDVANYVQVIERYEAIRDEDKLQRDLAEFQRRLGAPDGGGGVGNLRIREDTAKYLLNLDEKSAYYDPKSRSMREDPLPAADPKEKFYAGDNHNRMSGQALDFKRLYNFAWEASEKGYDIHVQGAPSEAELLYKNYKINKEKLEGSR